jgi:phage/plasmid primase-like uncharacterized protein
MGKIIISKPKPEPTVVAKPDVKVRLTFYLSVPEAEQLRKICEADDISVSHKIRQHVKQLLQHHHQQ